MHEQAREAGLLAVKLEISSARIAVIDHKWRGEGIASTFNRVYLPKSGEAFVRCGEETTVMEPGYAYFIPAGTTISFRCDTVMEKIFFHFNLYRPDHYDFFYRLDRIARIPVASSDYEMLERSLMGDRYVDSVSVQLFLMEMIREIQLVNGMTEEIPCYSEYVQDTLDYIHDHLSAGLRVSELARRLFVSRSYLADLFCKELGVTPGKYIDDQLLLAAQWRLQQTDASMAEISRELGYSDQFYFSRRFKQLCGLTPFTYRKYHRG